MASITLIKIYFVAEGILNMLVAYKLVQDYNKYVKKNCKHTMSFAIF